MSNQDDKSQLEEALRLGSGWVGGTPAAGTIFTRVAGGIGDFEELDPPLEVQIDGSLKPYIQNTKYLNNYGIQN